MRATRSVTHRGVATAMACALLLCGASAQALAHIPEGSHVAWHALLHYQGADGRWLSDIEDLSFFLDVEGRHNPEREWDAARRAFLAPADQERLEEHAQCRFPARFALMKDALGWSDRDIQHVGCPEVAAHKHLIGATSLSVVFISHYLSNPASAFGHTMLYLGSGSDRSAVLADYSVSFEADTDGLAPIQYLPRGLFGKLVAAYRLAPLHERVRRYEREEQRDLWMFPLQVSQEEIDQLVRHLWELKSVTFRYGFFGGNCAQKILAVVHAVAPRFEVLPYRRAAVLPSDVGRRLVEKIGLADKPIYRPSLSSQYVRLVAGLSPRERAQLDDMVASRTVVEGSSAAALQAALLWSEFETPDRAFRRAAETEDHRDFVWRRALWTARVASEATGEDELVSSIQESGPSLLDAHRPSRIVVRGGYRKGSGSVMSASARWLLHEAVDPHVGYPPVSIIEAGRIDFGVSTAGDFFVDEATVIRVAKLAPASHLQSAFAWKFDLGARRLAHDGALPLHLGAEFGVGLGTALLRPGYSVAVYSLIGARPGIVLSGETSFLAAGIWSGGLVLRLPADFRAHVSGEYSVSLGSLRGGAAALNVVARKGLTLALDLEFAGIIGPQRSGVTLGFVSFR